MRLQSYVDDNTLDAKILEFDTPTLTVEQSMKANNCLPEDIVKSILVKTKSNEYYLVLLQGNRRIKTGKLKKLLKVKDVKLASPEDVEKVTDYKVGEVPPISIDLPVIIDELVIEKGGTIYGGGGGSTKSLRITIDDLLDCTHPLIADISNPL
jgi:prolyl-tRNA editing enzyme YbaK/EbsC (Cys-tRNA(Pro) deacylase)